MIRRYLGAAALATIALASAVEAQPPRGGGRPALGQLARVVQRRLGLSDEQALRLRETTSRFATQRQQLMAREREARRSLRISAEAGDSADQQAIARELDALLEVQERRAQIVVEEQRELARFLAPLQRARYLALQERAFRAAQQQRQQRQQRLQGPPGGFPPGGEERRPPL